jgi:radical SAM superfamily enzyme YgiQ (UPF0313 family)
MALFQASTQKMGYEFFGYDLNVDLHNVATIEDKKLWEGQFAFQWVTESNRIIEDYAGFLNNYVDNMIAEKIELYVICINCYSRTLGFYMAEKIKEKNPSAQIMMGGPQCFPAYEGVKILENEFVDAIGTGEGDVVWPKIVEHFVKNKNLRLNLPGIAYKNEDGTIVDNGIPELVSDLDNVPFADYDDVDFAKYGNTYQISMMTSRGCINTCAFCSERPNFYKYRTRSAENIFQEVKKHVNSFNNNKTVNHQRKKSFLSKLFNLKNKNYITLNISFNDSLINGVPKELEKFCDLVIESGIKFNWSGMALIRKEMTPELLAKMKKAGCVHMSWGLESGCQRVLDLMHKRFFTMDLARKIIKQTYEAGIQQACSVIVGFPGETEEMFEETVEFFKEYKKYFNNVGVQSMMVLKNSYVYDNLDEFGLRFEDLGDCVRWHSQDGQNNIELRQKRLEILKAILDDKIITTDKE